MERSVRPSASERPSARKSVFGFGRRSSAAPEKDASEDVAATKLQAAVRGHGTRKRLSLGEVSQSVEDAVAKAIEEGAGALHRATIIVQSNYRRHAARLSVGGVVRQAQMVHSAKLGFKKLLKPNRPPMPGTATPAGYVINLKPAPADATWAERFRDWLLILLTSPFFAYASLVVILMLVGAGIVLVTCIMYWYDWGVDVFPESYVCTFNYECCPCNVTTGRLTYGVQDYWQARAAQVISGILTYNVFLASTWRISIAAQVLNTSGRCPRKLSGVDFYGRKNEMPFFHIPHAKRMWIALFLNLNTGFQICHQTFHALWNEPIGSLLTYMEFPESLLSALSGFVAGIITGGIAATIQFRAESQLHREHPERFPPTPIESYKEIRAKQKAGQSLASIFKEMKNSKPNAGTDKRLRSRSKEATNQKTSKV